MVKAADRIWNESSAVSFSVVSFSVVSFRNPEDMILEEIAKAHAQFSGHLHSKLEEVRVCLYPRGTAVGVQGRLDQLVSLAGCAAQAEDGATT